MVDATVEAKPMPHLPIDPDTIPEAVKKRAAAVDALYAAQPPTNGNAAPAAQPEPPPPQQEAAAPLPAAVEEAETPAPPPQAETAPPPPEEDSAENWKRRFLRMQGQYNASQKTLGEMQEQMAQLGGELLAVQQVVAQPRSPPRPPTPPPSYLTEQDVQNYGADLVDFTQRAAAQALAPTIQQIEQQNAELQRRLAIEARRAMDQRVELAVPNYREIDRDPRWHHWLLGVDLLSGRVRQQLLNEAIASADAPRAISFFRGFQQEEVATGHNEPAPVSHQAAPPREPAIPLASLAAPGRARPATGGDASLPPEKPIYTRAQIAQLYSAHRKGAYVGREAEWARQDADIFAAGREGRIR